VAAAERDVVDGSSGATVVRAKQRDVHDSRADRQVLSRAAAVGAHRRPFASISGTPATAAKHLSNASIGLDRAGAAGNSRRSHANSKYVTAGSAPLIASATAIGAGEQFEQLDAGNGNTALRATANGQIGRQRRGGFSLIANRTAIGPWETCTLIRNPDRSVSLRALVNNTYIAAENAGAAPLIAIAPRSGRGKNSTPSPIDQTRTEGVVMIRLIRLIRLAVCGTVLAAVMTAPALATAATPWTGTRAAAQLSSGVTFNQQTLRQIVHTSIGGSVARVQLSNVFGTQAQAIRSPSP
jgi:hypothetical protein